ncbi:hypothetical protein BFF48_22175 [Shigella sp. FC1882]|nr:hypothetical protein BFF48_22175 [Shigella sp. FC1882]
MFSHPVYLFLREFSLQDSRGGSKGLPESGKGEALEIPHSPEKEPVSCLTDWHYSLRDGIFYG